MGGVEPFIPELVDGGSVVGRRNDLQIDRPVEVFSSIETPSAGYVATGALTRLSLHDLFALYRSYGLGRQDRARVQA
jgi:hypothetical protein